MSVLVWWVQHNLSGREIYLVPRAWNELEDTVDPWVPRTGHNNPTGSLGSSSVRIGARKADQMEGRSDLSVKSESDLAESLGRS